MLVLTLPDSGPHDTSDWLSMWERAYGYQRVDQHDWQSPRRGDWSARLDELMADADAPVTLVANGLGCVLVAWWAAHSLHVNKVHAALLVNPLDVERDEYAQQNLSSWVPLCLKPLPFSSLLIHAEGSDNCSRSRASWMAEHWTGGAWVEMDLLGEMGGEEISFSEHFWNEGHSALMELMG